jgi:hypothetical protein
MAYYPPNYNMGNSMQQRLSQMEQQFPQFAQPNYMNQMPMIQTPTQTLKGRPVTSIDEAKAAQIDFDGSLHVFPDVANGNIYTKQLGMDGLPIFTIYRRDTSAQDTKSGSSETKNAESQYVLRSDFEELKDKFQKLENSIAEDKKFAKGGNNK